MHSNDKHKLTIPTLIHFVWMGSDLSNPYLEILGKWRKLNPLFEINLWVNQNLSVSSKSNLKAIGINICEISDYQQSLKNFELITSESQQIPINYSAIGDILRIDLIEEFGGFYFDIAIIPKKSIPETLIAKNISLESGYLCSVEKNNEVDEPYIGNNNVHAAYPHHILYQKAQAILKQIHTCLDNEDSRSYLNTGNVDINYYITRTRTGRAIYFAMDALMDDLNSSNDPIEKHSLEAYDIGIPKNESSLKRKHPPTEIFKAGITKQREVLAIIKENIFPHHSIEIPNNINHSIKANGQNKIKTLYRQHLWIFIDQFMLHLQGLPIYQERFFGLFKSEDVNYHFSKTIYQQLMGLKEEKNLDYILTVEKLVDILNTYSKNIAADTISTYSTKFDTFMRSWHLPTKDIELPDIMIMIKDRIKTEMKP